MAFVTAQIPALGLNGESSVVEVGSRNINGSVRPLFAAAGFYIGIDLDRGEGVDRVSTVERFASEENREAFDVVVSCEMLEHAETWQDAFRAMVSLLQPGGTLLLTTRSPGFPYHNPPDHWRFLPRTLAEACLACGLGIDVIETDPQVPGVFLRATKERMPEAIRIDAAGNLWTNGAATGVSATVKFRSVGLDTAPGGAPFDDEGRG